MSTKSNGRSKPAAKAKKTRPKANASSTHDSPEVWKLRLYVAGQTPRSIAAFANLRRMCEQHLPGRYRLEVIDLLKDPQLAQGDQILAIPTLVRKLPPPMKKIVGDLSNQERFLVGFDLKH